MTTRTTDAVDTDRATFFAAMGWDGGRVEVVAGTNQADNPAELPGAAHEDETRAEKEK